MPRISIIVPFRSEKEDFEATLISILENRPDNCEVIVAHDGSYNDPFDLQDEVLFAVGNDDSFITLVRTAAEIATSPIVHILGDGVVAAEGWTHSAIDAFEDEDVACVVPLICDESDPSRILAAGWTTDSLRLRRRVADGATAVGRNESARIEGVFLAASFWRRRHLLRASRIADVRSVAEAEAVWAEYVRRCGLELRLVSESRVTTYSDSVDLQTSGFSVGYECQVSREAAQPRSAMSEFGLAVVSAVTRPHRFQSWTTSLGRIAAVVSGQSRAKNIESLLQSALDEGPVANEAAQVLRFPEPVTQPLRNAA